TGVHRYVALQAHYNLVHREYEEHLAALCEQEGLSCLAYAALADGFLTGKYRPGAELPRSERVGDAAPYLDDRGVAVLGALDVVPGRRRAAVATVALAWLIAQPTVAAAVVSARTTDQLQDLLAAATLELDAVDLEMVDAASVSTNR